MVMMAESDFRALSVLNTSAVTLARLSESARESIAVIRSICSIIN
jgi:hypothetical protein